MSIRRLSSAPRVHGWSRRARAVNPRPMAPNREMTQLGQDLPQVLRRMVDHGTPSSLTSADLSRQALTRLQREMQSATEASVGVARDNFLQGVRKHLHLLLDH